MLAQTFTADKVSELANHVVAYVTAATAAVAAITAACVMLIAALKRAKAVADDFKAALVSTVQGAQEGMQELGQVDPTLAEKFKDTLRKVHSVSGVMAVVAPIVDEVKKEEEKK